MRNSISVLNESGAARKRAGCVMAVTPQQAENRGMAWVMAAFLFCPCHLPLTLGLAGVLLSGTAAGVMLQSHPYAAGSIITAIWLAGTWRGIQYFRSARTFAQAVLHPKPGGPARRDAS
jgi:MerE protein